MITVMKEQKFTVILFYKFITIDNPEQLKKEQRELCERLNLKGRVILAREGINATLEGDKEAIEEYKKALKQDARFTDVVFKESEGNAEAFPKLAVKVRDEIVVLKAGEFDVLKETAPVLTADELEELYKKDEDFVVLDLRNDYEINCGQFEKTFDPKLENFRDLPAKLETIKSLKDKKVVTVCTGGIRCEKATCLLKREGFKNIYQLKDGIHTYMLKYPASRFKGTLYVFDNRITTPVEEAPNREVIGRCYFCEKPTEQYANDDSVRPTKKLLCCEACFEARKDALRGIVSPKGVK